MPSMRLLNDLVQTFIDPALESVDRAVEHYGRITAALSAVEAYGWALLGLRIGAIPREAARELFRRRAERLMECVDVATEEAAGAFDPGILGEMTHLIATEEYVPFESERPPGNQFQSFVALPTAFAMWYAEVNRFAQSVEASDFVGLLNFANRSRWNRTAEQLGKTTDPNLGLVSADADLPIYVGYTSSLRHMGAMVSLVETRDIQEQYWGPWAVLRVEVGRVNGWRLRFQNRIFLNRFDEVTTSCDGRLVREAARVEAPIGSGAFTDAVQILKYRYIQAFGYLPMDSA